MGRWNSGNSHTAELRIVDQETALVGNDFELDDISLRKIFVLEPVLADWPIYLDENQNGIRDPGEPSTTTEVNGSYAFTHLSPGQYVVAEEMKPQWQQTSVGGVREAAALYAVSMHGVAT